EVVRRLTRRLGRLGRLARGRRAAPRLLDLPRLVERRAGGGIPLLRGSGPPRGRRRRTAAPRAGVGGRLVRRRGLARRGRRHGHRTLPPRRVTPAAAALVVLGLVLL